MKYLIIIICFIFNLVFSFVLPAQEARMKNTKIEKPYSKIIHSFAFEFNNAMYLKGKMMEHPYPYYGYETRLSYGTEWLLKYNLTFKSGFGISLETVKGTCNYRFNNRYTEFTDRGETPITYFFDNFTTWNKLGCNIKASYRYDINQWLTILPEIGLQMQYYRPFSSGHSTFSSSKYPDGTYSEEMIQHMEYSNEVFEKNFFPDLSASLNFLFHKKDDPRHNFTVGLNANLCFGVRYLGLYTVTPPFNMSDCLFFLTSNYIGLRFGYSYSSFAKPIHKKKEYRQKESYTILDLQKPIHAVGLSLSMGSSFNSRLKNPKGLVQPSSSSSFIPELTLKYSCAIKNGWGITAEIPFGVFTRYFEDGLIETTEYISKDTVWSNGVVGYGNWNSTGITCLYLGFALKASYLVQVHKNISLQSEAGFKWLPFLVPANRWGINESIGEFYISDGTETHDLVYMNCIPTISAASYAVPDLAFSFNVLVHGKNPSNNFVFGINGNISFLDRFHFAYQTTNILPQHLQSSGEFGWRMSSIGFHIGYQWMTGKKKQYNT